MELRPELMPPVLDGAEVDRLSALAAHLDGAPPERSADALAEFNRLAGTDLAWQDFQGVHNAEEHEAWVRRVLYRGRIRPAADVTRAELVEVVRRAMSIDEYPDDHEAYMAVFDANVPMSGASDMIFWPPEHHPPSVGAYSTAPERIVGWALSPKNAPIRL